MRKVDSSSRSSRLTLCKTTQRNALALGFGGAAKHLRKNEGTRPREEKREGISGEVAQVATHDAQEKGKRLTRVTRSTGCVIHD